MLRVMKISLRSSGYKVIAVKANHNDMKLSYFTIYILHA
jgi:hypothetical protein